MNGNNYNGRQKADSIYGDLSGCFLSLSALFSLQALLNYYLVSFSYFVNKLT